MKKHDLLALGSAIFVCISLLTACRKQDAAAPVTNDSSDPIVKATTATNTGGFSTASGSTSTAVTVTTLSQLQTAFNNKSHHIIISGHISGGSIPLTFTFSTADWNNTTIEGLSGGGAQLENIQLKFDGELLATGTNIQNIVVSNISFYGNIASLQALPSSETDISVSGNHTGVNYLGVSFRRITNARITHCTIFNTSDDLWSVALASDNITVDNCHFYFTSSWVNMSPNPSWNWVGSYSPLAGERIAAVLGANWSDSYTYGTGALHITMHDNWFGPFMRGRPLCRGYIHAYNNYFDNGQSGNTGQYNALQIGSGCKVYSENNYFYQTTNSNQVGLDDNTHTAYTFCERNNTYNGGSHGTVGAAWPGTAPVSYSYTLISGASNIPSSVQTNAGPK